MLSSTIRSARADYLGLTSDLCRAGDSLLGCGMIGDMKVLKAEFDSVLAKLLSAPATPKADISRKIAEKRAKRAKKADRR